MILAEYDALAQEIVAIFRRLLQCVQTLVLAVFDLVLII